jgi:ABC-type antimicrobial peptide transport system permease subunit
VAAVKADEHFIPLYGIRLLAGRNLLPGDTLKEVVINESLSKLLGFASPEKALGQSIYTWNKYCPIAGVVADFHQASFHETIKPMLITSLACTDIAVKLDTRNKSVAETKAILARVENQWKAFYPHTPFEYDFLDESIARLYQKEQTTSWLMNITTGITIFISCIGLFGLTMFTTARRTREIGIRKVLGASVPDIVALLGKDFFILIVIALFIASPVAWFFMHQWLEDYAYRIPFGVDIFLIAGVTILFITLLTVSFQSVKAALANPVKSLRTE